MASDVEEKAYTQYIHIRVYSSIIKILFPTLGKEKNPTLFFHFAKASL